MHWLTSLQIFNTEKDTIKIKNLLIQYHTSHPYTKLRNVGIIETLSM